MTTHKHVTIATTVENDKYVAFARRVIRGAGRRLADNPDDLARLAELRAEVDDALGHAVANARANYGLSWRDIGDNLGITRQSAQERFGRYCLSPDLTTVNPLD